MGKNTEILFVGQPVFKQIMNLGEKSRHKRADTKA